MEGAPQESPAPAEKSTDETRSAEETRGCRNSQAQAERGEYIYAQYQLEKRCRVIGEEAIVLEVRASVTAVISIDPAGQGLPFPQRALETEDIRHVDGTVMAPLELRDRQSESRQSGRCRQHKDPRATLWPGLASKLFHSVTRFGVKAGSPRFRAACSPRSPSVRELDSGRIQVQDGEDLLDDREVFAREQLFESPPKPWVDLVRIPRVPYFPRRD